MSRDPDARLPDSRQLGELVPQRAQCVQSLPDLWRNIIRSRYWMNLPVGDVARRVARTENSVAVTLNKIRSRLADCVEQRLRTGDAP